MKIYFFQGEESKAPMTYATVLLLFDTIIP